GATESGRLLCEIRLFQICRSRTNEHQRAKAGEHRRAREDSSRSAIFLYLEKWVRLKADGESHFRSVGQDNVTRRTSIEQDAIANFTADTEWKSLCRGEIDSRADSSKTEFVGSQTRLG